MDTQEKNYTSEVNAGRIELMEEIAASRKWTEENDDKMPEDNENHREPLCIDTQIVKKIVLSTGGPEDGVKLFFDTMDGKKELSYGVYYRADWREYEESTLSDDEAQTVFDFYLGGYIE